MSMSINNQLTNLNFKADSTQVNKSKKVATNPQEDKKELSKNTKIAIGIGATALAAIALGGIYLATKGKVKTTPTSKTGTGVTNDIKEMTMNAFKEAGNKFSKGKAVTENGEMFSGVLKHEKKDGTNLVMTYENGLLKQSKVMLGENVRFIKTYTYDNNSKMSSILHIYTDAKTNEVLNKRYEFIHDDKTGKLKRYKNQEVIPGEIPSWTEIIYNEDGSYKYSQEVLMYTINNNQQIEFI